MIEAILDPSFRENVSIQDTITLILDIFGLGIPFFRVGKLKIEMKKRQKK